MGPPNTPTYASCATPAAFAASMTAACWAVRRAYVGTGDQQHAVLGPERVGERLGLLVVGDVRSNTLRTASASCAAMSEA